MLSIHMAQDKDLSTIKDAETRLDDLNEETSIRLMKLQKIAKQTLDEKKSLKKGYSKEREVVTD